MTDITHRGRKYQVNGASDTDHIANLLARSGTFYEIDLLTYIESIKDYLPDGVAIDVGANIGNHTIFLSEFVRSPVVGFEPNGGVLPVLKSNLATNHISAQIIELGLGTCAGRGSIEVVDQANIGNTRIVSGDDIEISTLDEECRDMQVALIKVDVEGMELQVLQGGVETLKRCRPHLFLEAATEDNFRELKEFLAPLGYRPVVRWAYTPVWHFAVNPPRGLVLRARWRRSTRGFRHLGMKFNLAIH
jgi:FkbM family methyltransferase